MYTDTIIKDVWKNKDEYLKNHSYNIDNIIKDLMQKQELSKKKFYTLQELPQKSANIKKQNQAQ
ncbi:MAG: hypothetical protein DRQ51_01070 [Gammaproteobacteria bacterium]|nr:MAG: hypothetical protein DRQ51_01070 [Gammaproteobacteria bacterium]